MNKRVGAVVGALLVITVAGGVTPVDAGGRPLSATMTGAEEVPGPGDPDGSGTARITLNQGRSSVCWSIDLSNVDPLPHAGHIHEAPAGTSGGIVLTLFGSPANSAPTTTPATPTTYPASACVENVDAALIKAIRQDPSAYYVNVHNTPFPAGAVRGQLGR